MDKTAAKNFALRAREELTNLVIVQAANLGITAEGIQKSKPLDDGIVINGQVFGHEMAKDYQHLLRRVETSGYHETMKEAIYTWFNRFVALRFMEVHDYLPIQMRILSSHTPGKKEPDAVTQAGRLIDELALDRELVYQLQDDHNIEQLFKYIIEKQSRQLEEKIPQVFKEVERDLYLLLPDGLLRENGFIDRLTQDIPEEDWQEIEIIGWLYQYYISEEKDRIFANLSKNKIGKDEIGAATQIFTPKWIVQYLVGNSLGRMWLEDYPNSKLREHLPYYVEDAEQPAEVIEQLEALKGTPINPEEIKIMDPSLGSGHMLLEAFDVMREIYLEQGYRPREIPSLILSKNLHGLDIDKRASQLAAFALVMKARQHDRRFFEREVKLNLLGFEESNGLPTVQNIELVNLDEVNEELEKLYLNFHDAKLYGSIIKLTPVDIGIIEQAVKDIKDISIKDIIARGYLEYEVPYIEQLIHQYQLLDQKYHVTVTNPPYMGSGGMSAPLSKYVKKHYPMSKSDLFAVMMEKMNEMTIGSGYMSYVTMQTWMFLSSFANFRKKILLSSTIVSMMHMGNTVMRIAFGTVATIIKKNKTDDFIGVYQKINSSDLAHDRPIRFPVYGLYYSKQNQNNFLRIPGFPIAYWLNDSTYLTFDNPTFTDFFVSGGRTKTHDNDKYVRFGWEINNKDKKWTNYINGGEFRKYYGNYLYVVNWSEEATNFYDSHGGLPNKKFDNQIGISYNLITSFKNGFILKKKEAKYSSGSPTIFVKEGVSKKTLNNALLFLNSKVSHYFLNFLNPTVNTSVGNVLNIPVLFNNLELDDCYTGNINNSIKDWNAFEISSDFEEHPFLKHAENDEQIEVIFKKWEHIASTRFKTVKNNEENLNQVFISLYGLQSVLNNEVNDKEITIRKANLKRDIRSFLSYLVGIIFGRYSLDEPGLIFAGGEYDRSRYHKYQPDMDNIIPLTLENYFNDDIVSRITELVHLIYGEEMLEENLLFIAQAFDMKGSESPRDTIRRYFMKEFFKDHKKIYKNRPIYWQLTSGKQEAFKGIFYLHRYDETTFARVRTEYVLPLTNTLTELSNQMQAIIDGSASNRDVANARKNLEKYQKQLQELRDYDLILKNLADQQIPLDLDDGVKVNYEKFQNIPVKNVRTGKAGKMNLLEKL